MRNEEPGLDGGPGEILVVDDNLATLKLLLDILVADGYRVRPANSGRLALASVEVRDALVEVGQVPGGDGEAVVFLRDNGVGFDMRYAGKLFAPFQLWWPGLQVRPRSTPGPSHRTRSGRG